MGPTYVAAAFAFTQHWASTDRFAALGDHLSASFNAQSIGARIEAGYRRGSWWPGVAFTPYAALQAQSFHTPAYSETDLNNGGFGLSFNARNASDTRSELGERIEKQVLVQSGAALVLHGKLAWAHDWFTDPALTAAFQALPGASFTVNGATPAKDAALLSTGAELRLPNGVSLSGKFDAEFANRAQTYAGTGTIRLAW